MQVPVDWEILLFNEKTRAEEDRAAWDRAAALTGYPEAAEAGAQENPRLDYRVRGGSLPSCNASFSKQNLWQF